MPELENSVRKRHLEPSSKVGHCTDLQRKRDCLGRWSEIKNRGGSIRGGSGSQRVSNEHAHTWRGSGLNQSNSKSVWQQQAQGCWPNFSPSFMQSFCCKPDRKCGKKSHQRLPYSYLSLEWVKLSLGWSRNLTSLPFFEDYHQVAFRCRPHGWGLRTVGKKQSCFTTSDKSEEFVIKFFTGTLK